MKFDEFKIKQLCDQYGIINYTIKDGLVDVNGHVDLYNIGLNKLPVQFDIVTGEFECSYNNLTSLEGSPKEVGGIFHCNDNKLKSLIGSPNIVGESFECSHNQLTDLLGSPKEVGGDFYCNRNNSLISLKGAPELIGGKFICNDTPIGSIYRSSGPGLIPMFNAIFMDGIDMEKIKYWFDIRNKTLTDKVLKEIKKYYPNI